MIDREKVIKGLECCTEDGCKDCPYYKNCDIFDEYISETLLKDVLEVLKEQKQEKNVYTWICPECESQIILKAYQVNKAIGMSFDCCPVCGKKVLYGKAD